MDLNELATVALAFLIVTISPGPANIAVATVSMDAGRRSGMLMGLGLSLGLAFWGLVAATGLGAVLQTSVTALMLLKVLGGLYLLWLAYQSLRSATRSDAAPRPPLAGRRWFWRGLLLNLSNPKAVVAWIAALSVGLHADDSPVVLASATLTCMGLGVLNYTGYALLFSLSGMMSAYARARRWIDGAVAALFAAAGLGLLRSAFTR